MAEKKYLLSIDNGTQSIRALLFDTEGNLLAKSQVVIEPYVSAQPGWAEQDPQYYWEMLCKACHGLWAELPIAKSEIAAASICCQRSTVVNLDKEGQPLRPAIIWLDQRVEQDLPDMGAWNLLFSAVGHRRTVQHFRSQAKSNWIARRQPEIWRKTDKFLMLSGYHAYRLTGDYVDSIASQVGYLPFDYKKQQWAGVKDWRWKALGISPGMLPKLIAPGKSMGAISAQASRETGIPEGLPLIASGSDKACEVLGSGSLSPDIGCLSYGTTATFNISSDRYREVAPPIPPYPAAVPNTYNAEIMIQRGYWMVSWFKREFGLREQEMAKKLGVAPEALFDELLKEVPPGSMGLTLQPYWSPGIKEPGPEAKGAIIGFGDVHTRAHIYRAIIEGLTYALRAGKERVEKRSGVKIKTLRVSGGGSQSDQVMQITADVFGIEAERLHTFETSGLGAAINAAVGIGFYANYQQAIDVMVRSGDVFTPQAQSCKVYDKLFHDVYQKMYVRLSPIYRAIRDITGYPGLNLVE
ncbi:FGGY-family carbohydrate kinase [Maricurvus nonylphenolicus]|uniref:FGGY-family carbohydrate kinase n=1 Tax=Maricurvus nonylphenolicus TaxID=1008307 RepID=UPI0036F3667A